MNEELGRNLCQLRKERGLSQEALALLAGLRRETVAKLESGTRSPRADTVRKLCAALQCGPNALYGFGDNDE